MGKCSRLFTARWNGTGRWEVIWLTGWDGTTRFLGGTGRDGKHEIRREHTVYIGESIGTIRSLFVLPIIIGLDLYHVQPHGQPKCLRCSNIGPLHLSLRDHMCRNWGCSVFILLETPRQSCRRHPSPQFPISMYCVCARGVYAFI